MCRAAFRLTFVTTTASLADGGTIMRAAWMTTLLLGVAAVAAACTAGPPDRAVMPSHNDG
jgi:hypothetical protein